MISIHAAVGLSMLAIILVSFIAMARYGVPQVVAMSLAACGCLVLNPGSAASFIESGFREFASIVVLFTAVAIPARMVERSGAFALLGATLGIRIGATGVSRPRFALTLLIATAVTSTFVTAALFHNITSILIMVPITISLCSSYGIPSRWLLSSQLIASNLGGFTTSWGDTPNIIESRIFHLSNLDFLREILPPNALLVGLLIVVATVLTRRELRRSNQPHDVVEMAGASADFRSERESVRLDRRLLIAGLAALAFFIVIQFSWRRFEIAAGALTIVSAILMERKDDRMRTLQSLDLELYMVLGSIFVLANALDRSWVGEQLMGAVTLLGGRPWAIAVTAYLGTAFTEAASWAAAVAGPIASVNPSHAAAWALGGGICAGSSSLVTAASAGIILSTQSRRYPGHEISFRKYLSFGLPASVVMLVFYATYFTILF